MGIFKRFLGLFRDPHDWQGDASRQTCQKCGAVREWVSNDAIEYGDGFPCGYWRIERNDA